MFADRHVFVSGAASGIGLGVARLLASRGARLTLIDLAPVPAGAIAAPEGRLIAIQADVRDAAAVQAALRAGLAAHGPLHGAVNCAGILGPVGRLHATPLSEVEALMAVNWRGVLHCMHAELAAMLPHRQGSIVSIASVAGTVGFPQAPAYTASKHAIVGLTRACALDYAEDGIRVNAIAPGGVETPLIQATTCATPEGRAMITGAHPMKRLADPAEIAEAAAFLLSPASGFITGTVLAVDGGWTAQ